MLRIIRFGRRYWYVMLVILVLLFAQANCDLALPEYTSKIVDIGITSKGIESPVLTRMRVQTYEDLLLFSDESEQEIIQSSYQEKDDEMILLNDITDEDMEELRSVVTKKQTMLLMFYSTKDEAKAMKNELAKSMNMPEDTDFMSVFRKMPKEYLTPVTTKMEEELSKMSDMIGESSAIEFASTEYAAMGVDIDRIQIDYLIEQGAQMMLLALLGMVISIIVSYLASILAAKVSMNLRNDVFQKVVSFSNAELNHFSTASLITRSTNDIQQVQMVMTMIFRIVVYAPILGIGGIYKVIQTNSKMEYIIVVAVGTVMLLVLLLMIIAMPKFKAMQSLVDGLNLVSREILTGIPVIRAFNREKTEKERFEEASNKLMKTQLFTNRTMAFMMPTMMFIMNAITILIVWVGAHRIEEGNLKVGTMMAFMTYTIQIVISFLMITVVSIMLPRASVAATRIEEVLKQKIEIKDSKAATHLPEDVLGDIAFHQVSFTYPKGEEEAVSDLTFTAKHGETTAIIGSTGCGKSTLVQLIPRLFDNTKGQITIDGIDIKDCTLESLRKQIGFVPQKGILFSGTIQSNIAFGNGDCDRDELVKAATTAQAMEFISDYENTFDAPIAQGGTNVSGGQKQRLSIARAIAKKPKIFIFDDSFSALDYKTDRALRQELLKQTKEATVLIVAQRISTILHADKIIVMDDGKIVGQGTHQELLEQNEVYQQIALSQLSEKELNITNHGLEA